MKENKVYYSLLKPILFVGLPPMVVLVAIAVNVVVAMAAMFLVGGKSILVLLALFCITSIALYLLRSGIQKDPKYAEVLKKRFLYDRKFLTKKEVIFWR